MSTIYVTKRICDVCQKEFGTPEKAWMVLTAPNMGEDAPVFDFCNWDCLLSWVNSTDDDEDVPEGVVEDRTAETAALAAVLNEELASAPVQQPAPRPAMSLADAIASGALTPGMRVQQ